MKLNERVDLLFDILAEQKDKIAFAFNKWKQAQENYTKSLRYGPSGEVTVDSRGYKSAETRAFRILRNIIKSQYNLGNSFEADRQVINIINKLQDNI